MCGCLLHILYWAPGLQPRHVPRLGIEPATLWFTAHAQSTEVDQPGLAESSAQGFTRVQSKGQLGMQYHLGVRILHQGHSGQLRSTPCSSRDEDSVLLLAVAGTAVSSKKPSQPRHTATSQHGSFFKYSRRTPLQSASSEPYNLT